jgi:hypothetical protein
MTVLDLLIASDTPVVLDLLTGSEACGAVHQASGFDNQPTWDNKTGGGSFDNRPTWDNWSKK